MFDLLDEGILEFWALLRARYGVNKRIATFREIAEAVSDAGSVPPALEGLIAEAEAIAAEW